MIQAVSANGADESFHIRILPGALRRCDDFIYTHVIFQKHPSGLRRWLMISGRHQIGDRSLGDLNAKFKQLAWILGAPHSGLAMAILRTRGFDG